MATATPPAHWMQQHWHPSHWHPGHWVGTPVDVIPFEHEWDSIWWRICKAVRDKMQGLGLYQLTSDRIYLQKKPRRNAELDLLPAVYVFPDRDNYPTRGTSQREWVRYGVGVVTVISEKEHQLNDFDLELYWREKIANHFRHQRLPGVDEVYDCTIETGSLFAQSKFFGEGLDVNVLTLRFTAAQPRSYTVLS